MTTKPSKYPEWSSDGAHTIEPPAGLKSTGWLSGQMAVPGYWNWVANNTYQWVQYFDGLNTAERTLPLSVASAKTWGAGATATLTQSGSTRYVLVNTGPADISWDIQIPAGSTITHCTLLYNREGSASLGIDLNVWSAAGSQTVIRSAVDNVSSGDTSLDLATSGTAGLGLPYTTVANTTLSLDIDAQTNAKIYGATIAFTVPA